MPTKARSGSSAKAAPKATKRSARPKTPKKRTRPLRPICNFTLDDVACRKRGTHFCEPRADKVCKFFEEVLVHTKGQWARQRFLLEPWQRDDILRPVFGTVVWDDEWHCYRRQYRILWIEIARKNGKSELLAGIALYLLVADDEESPEIYGAASDKDQAAKVWEVAERMAQLSPVLNARLKVNVQRKRIIDEKSAGYYEVVAADAAGNLGHNPHGVVVDEFLTQKGRALWDALRTAAGARVQQLIVVATTAGNDPESFAAHEHMEMTRVAEDPARAPHVFVYMRNTPPKADVFDEKNWAYPNPALGQFLAVSALRDEALEARNDPLKENAFRQFRANQWVNQATRWLPLLLWDRNAGAVDEKALSGQRCFGGLDLAAASDLASAAWLFPPTTAGSPDPVKVLWRFWAPQDRVAFYDSHTGGAFSQWVKAGLVTLTEGDWIDFERIREDLDKDLRTFKVVELGYDPWGAPDTVQWMQRRQLTVWPVPQSYAGLSEAMQEVMRLLKATAFHHGGNPVARWHADSVEAKHPPDNPDIIRYVRPKRDASGKRIDGIAAAVMAMAARLRPRDEMPPPATAASTGSTPVPSGPGDTFRPTSRLNI